MAMCPACDHQVRTPSFLNLDGWRHLRCPYCKARLEMKPPGSFLLGALIAPLFVLALAWDHYDFGHAGWLRGGPVRLGKVTLHSTNLVAGSLFVVLGTSFIASQGGSLLSGVYDDLGLSALGFRIESWVASTF